MKNVTFKEVNPSTHVIFINGHKAGLLQLSIITEPKENHQPNNWRVFFWGNYKKFQVNYENIGMSFIKCSTDISLNDLKLKITAAINNNINAILPKEYFYERGYVLCHSDNGEIYTISTEYQNSFTEYFSIYDNHHLHDTVSVLKESAEKLVKYYKDNGFSGYGEITNIEYVMTNPIFNTAYYSS